MKLRVLTAVAIVGALIIGAAVLFREAPGVPLPDNVEADSVVVEKSKHTMSLLKNGEVLRTYRVALGRGGPEPKSQEGDARTPQGAYHIDRHNPRSSFYRALHISYPNATDIAAASARGVSAGSDVEIHGIRNGLGWLGSLHRAVDWTAGCIALTDSEMDEVWRAVPDGTTVVIRQ
jgi:murein L,D-transpeptidase YafK